MYSRYLINILSSHQACELSLSLASLSSFCRHVQLIIATLLPFFKSWLTAQWGILSITVIIIKKVSKIFTIKTLPLVPYHQQIHSKVPSWTCKIIEMWMLSTLPLSCCRIHCPTGLHVTCLSWLRIFAVADLNPGMLSPPLLQLQFSMYPTQFWKAWLLAKLPFTVSLRGI